MELKKYNANHTQVLKINQIVRTISETHKFDKDKLIAINTSDVENGVMGNGTLTFVDELKGQFKKTIVKDDILFSEIRPANRRFAKVTTKNTKDYVVSTKLMVLRKYNEDVDLEYFYYCLTNQPFLDILQRRAENRIGSFPQITFDLLSEYAFPIPPISEQKRISSVISTLDKKIALNRQINQNFVDVYYNWAITIAQHDSFMLATARPNEISKFQLKKGQVALTKDSETRDDIGISTYIADDFENVILGYHCALISPNKDILDGCYLNALLHTDYAKKYFACNASGSGQRYALSVEALNSFPVPIIPLHEQKQIGEIFSALDKKIELNRQINQNLPILDRSSEEAGVHLAA